jgi:hypothetical protein
MRTIIHRPHRDKLVVWLTVTPIQIPTGWDFPQIRCAARHAAASHREKVPLRKHGEGGAACRFPIQMYAASGGV